MNACPSLLVKVLIEEVVTEGTFAGRPKYRARRNSVPSIAVTFAVPGYGDGFDVPRVVLSVSVVYVAMGFTESAAV